MKSEWKECTIGDLGEIVTGKTPSTKNADFWDGKIHFITPKDIQGLKKITKTERTITDDGLQKVKGSILPQNAVCVSCIGNIGYTGITTQPCVTNQQINSIITNQENDPDFVYYLMRSLWPFFKNYEGQSTTLSILNKTQFAKIAISVPDLYIQKQIATLLSAMDTKIETNVRINDNLQQQAFTIFDSLLSNTHSSECCLSEIAAINPKRILKKNEPARCIDMTQLSTSGSFPNGWEIKLYNGGMRFSNGIHYWQELLHALRMEKRHILIFSMKTK